MALPNGNYRRASRGTALYMTMAAAFIIILLIVAMALFFKVSEISVEGAVKYTPEEIVKASGIEEDSSILFIGTGSAEVAVKSELPYVDSVKITKKLPGTVVITVTESVAAASFTDGSGWWIMDLDGRVLEETTAAGAQGTIEIRGIAPKDPEVGESLSLGSGESVRLRALLDILSALSGDKKLDLTEWVDVSNLSAITFRYNGYNVNVGQADNLTTKLSCLNQFLTEHPETGYGQQLIYDETQNRLLYIP